MSASDLDTEARRKDSSSNQSIKFNPRTDTTLAYEALLVQGSSTPPSSEDLDNLFKKNAPAQILQMEVNVRKIDANRLHCTDGNSNATAAIYDERNKDLSKHRSFHHRDVYAFVTGVQVVATNGFINVDSAELVCVTPAEAEEAPQRQFRAVPLTKESIERAIKILKGWQDNFSGLTTDDLFDKFLECFENAYPFNNDESIMCEFINNFLCHDNEIKGIQRWCGAYFDDPQQRVELSKNKRFLRRFIDENVPLVFGISMHLLSCLHRSCCRKRLHSGSAGKKYNDYFESGEDPHSSDLVVLHYHIVSSTEELRSALKDSQEISRKLQEQHTTAQPHSLRNHLVSIVQLLKQKCEEKELLYLFPSENDATWDIESLEKLSEGLKSILPEALRDEFSNCYVSLGRKQRYSVSKIYWELWYGLFNDIVRTVLVDSLDTYSLEKIACKDTEPLLCSKLSKKEPDSVTLFVNDWPKTINFNVTKFHPGCEFSKQRVKYTSSSKFGLKHGTDLDAIVYYLLLFSRLNESCYKALIGFLSFEPKTLFGQDESIDSCTEVLQASHFLITYSTYVINKSYKASLSGPALNTWTSGGEHLHVSIRQLSFVRLNAPLIYAVFQNKIGWKLEESEVIQSLRASCLGIDPTIFSGVMQNSYLIDTIAEFDDKEDCRSQCKPCYLLTEGLIAHMDEIDSRKLENYFKPTKKDGRFHTIPKESPSLEEFDFNAFMEKIYQDPIFRQNISSSLRLWYSHLNEKNVGFSYDVKLSRHSVNVSTESATKKVKTMCHELRNKCDEVLALMDSVHNADHSVVIPDDYYHIMNDLKSLLSVFRGQFNRFDPDPNQLNKEVCQLGGCTAELYDDEGVVDLSLGQCSTCGIFFHKFHLDKDPAVNQEDRTDWKSLCPPCVSKELMTNLGYCHYCIKHALLAELVKCEDCSRNYFHQRCFDSSKKHYFSYRNIDRRVCQPCMGDYVLKYCCNHNSGIYTCTDHEQIDESDDSVIKCKHCGGYAHLHCQSPYSNQLEEYQYVSDPVCYTCQEILENP
eukprot:scaffold18959_cov67-Cyclotella_meneghiniana.AAC.2